MSLRLNISGIFLYLIMFLIYLANVVNAYDVLIKLFPSILQLLYQCLISISWTRVVTISMYPSRVP